MPRTTWPGRIDKRIVEKLLNFVNHSLLVILDVLGQFQHPGGLFQDVGLVSHANRRLGIAHQQT